MTQLLWSVHNDWCNQSRAESSAKSSQVCVKPSLVLSVAEAGALGPCLGRFALPVCAREKQHISSGCSMPRNGFDPFREAAWFSPSQIPSAAWLFTHQVLTCIGVLYSC